MFSKQPNFDKLDKDYKFTLKKIQEDQNFTFDFNEFSTGVIPNYITEKQVYEVLGNHTEKSMFLILSDYGESVEYILNMFDYNVNLRCVCFTKSAKYTCIKSLKRYVENPEDFVIFIEGKIEDNPLLKDIINDKEMGFIDKIICVGNPPYQGINHQQIYPKIYVWAIKYCDEVCMIFPTGWMEAKNANGLKLMNTKEIKKDHQIVSIDVRHNVFPNVSGAEYTNIIHWKQGYDNGLNGKQLVYTDGENPVETEFSILKEEIEKPEEIETLGKIVMNYKEFKSLQKITSISKPYGIRKNVFDKNEYYNLPKMNMEKKCEDDITVYGSNGRMRFIPIDYPLPRKTKAFNKFKVFVGSAWGNMSEKNYLGGAYADIIIGHPYDICTETYQESGIFDTYDTALKHAKYLLTKFSRSCLYVNKFSQMSTQSWGSVPIQDYTEDWWDIDNIDEIDEHLFDKYGVPEDIREFIRKNIQPRTINNIIGYMGESDYSKAIVDESEDSEDED